MKEPIEEEEKFFLQKIELAWRTFACKACGDEKTYWTGIQIDPEATRHTHFCPTCRKIMPYTEVAAKPPQQSH